MCYFVQMKMSFLSLPRNLASDSLRNSTTSVDQNVKYLSLNNRRTTRKTNLLSAASTLSLQVPPRRRILNRNGSISAHHFRGVHKHQLEQHAETVCHTMTVSDLHKYDICRYSSVLSKFWILLCVNSVIDRQMIEMLYAYYLLFKCKVLFYFVSFFRKTENISISTYNMKAFIFKYLKKVRASINF